MWKTVSFSTCVFYVILNRRNIFIIIFWSYCCIFIDATIEPLKYLIEKPNGPGSEATL